MLLFHHEVNRPFRADWAQKAGRKTVWYNETGAILFGKNAKVNCQMHNLNSDESREPKRGGCVAGELLRRSTDCSPGKWYGIFQLSVIRLKAHYCIFSGGWPNYMSYKSLPEIGKRPKRKRKAS